MNIITTPLKPTGFSPNSSSIATARQAGSQTNIIVSALDGTGPRTILKTHLSQVRLSWASQHMLGLQTTDDSNISTLYTLTDVGDLTKILDSKPGLDIAWAPDGLSLVYSTADEQNISLLQIAGAQEKILGIKTPAHLCGWYLDSASIICAVAREGSMDIQKLALTQTSPQTLFSNLIISPNKILLSGQENFLVLQNSSDSYLYSLKLP